MVSRDEAINFNADIANTNQFNFFKYKPNRTKLRLYYWMFIRLLLLYKKSL